MAGTPLASMKTGAKTFIDIISQSTGGQPDGEIGSGSRIGIVSFANTAVQNTQMITSVDDLKTAVDGLTAGGNTNHADAFSQALALFDPSSGNAKVMVMFTDGNTTTGAPPAPVAAAARAQGVIIYCIGLVGSDGLDVDALNDWATDPNDTHVAITPDEAELEELFAELAANISKTGATNIEINEVVTSDFVITSVLNPTVGSAAMLSSTSLRWTIPELGVSAPESALLEFFIRHVGTDPGTKLVNESITYTDDEGNVAVFPEPMVAVECDVVICAEECPDPVELTLEGCADSMEVDMGDVYLSSLGSILELSVTIKQVCPRKRVALAVILTEVGKNGAEYQRGMKTMTIPAHNFSRCRDILVKCIRFVLPEDLDVSCCGTPCKCDPRKFKVRLLANTIDTDFRCCDSVVTL